MPSFRSPTKATSRRRTSLAASTLSGAVRLGGSTQEFWGGLLATRQRVTNDSGRGTGGAGEPEEEPEGARRGQAGDVEAWHAALHAGVDKAVVEINRSQRLVIAKDGTQAVYERLLIATGSNPFILPIEGHDLEGVVAFRDVFDVNKMLSYSEHKTGDFSASP